MCVCLCVWNHCSGPFLFIIKYKNSTFLALFFAGIFIFKIYVPIASHDSFSTEKYYFSLIPVKKYYKWEFVPYTNLIGYERHRRGSYRKYSSIRSNEKLNWTRQPRCHCSWYTKTHLGRGQAVFIKHLA